MAKTEPSTTMTATVVGALVGATVGYLFFTESGRSLRRRLEPALEDFARELMSFRNAVENTLGVVSEGWRSLTEAVGTGDRPAPPYPPVRQTAPF